MLSVFVCAEWSEISVKKMGRMQLPCNCRSTAAGAPEMLQNKAWIVFMYCIKNIQPVCRWRGWYAWQGCLCSAEVKVGPLWSKGNCCCNLHPGSLTWAGLQTTEWQRWREAFYETKWYSGNHMGYGPVQLPLFTELMRNITILRSGAL